MPTPSWTRTVVEQLGESSASFHTLKPAPKRPRCDVRRQSLLEAELTGWFATARAHSGDLRVTLVIPDDTRPISPSLVVPPVLECVAEAARRRGGRIKAHVLIGLGLHRAPQEAFIEQLTASIEPFYPDPMMEVTWSWHDAYETERGGFPLNPRVLDRSKGGAGVDCVVTIGTVEPHQYAGFSGGSKGLTIGCGAASTIAGVHSVELLREPGVTIGKIEGNPFRGALDAVAQQHAAPVFTICLVPDPGKDGFIGLFGGASSKIFSRAVRLAESQLLVPVGKSFDFAVVKVPDSKSASFYQASRALTYLALHPSPCVKPGGTLVLDASCLEGFGEGRGEVAFQNTLARGRERLLLELAGKLTPPEKLGGGAQRAYVLAKAMQRFRCVLVGAPELPEARAAGLLQISSLRELELAGDGLIVDDPFVMMPYHDTEDRSLDRIIPLSDCAP